MLKGSILSSYSHDLVGRLRILRAAMGLVLAIPWVWIDFRIMCSPDAPDLHPPVPPGATAVEAVLNALVDVVLSTLVDVALMVLPVVILVRFALRKKPKLDGFVGLFLFLVIVWLAVSPHPITFANPVIVFLLGLHALAILLALWELRATPTGSSVEA